MHPVHLASEPNQLIVDVRDQSERTRDGVFIGAIALDAAAVIARLVPGLPTSLSAAHPDAQWLLVSSNGATASAIAARLRDRGVQAGAVEGGYRALAHGLSAPAGAPNAGYWRTLASFAAHEA